MHQEWFSERKEIASMGESVLSDLRESLMKPVDMKFKIYVGRLIDPHELEIVDGHLNP